MKKSLLSLIFLLISFFNNMAFAEINFLSPVEGIWGNKQMLAIDNISEGDYFYSIDGSDPEVFGFAYDNPVLIDLEGDVCLKVVHINVDGSKEYSTVNYKVIPNRGSYKSYSSFISSFYNTGIFEFTGSEQLSIPENLYFSLDRENEEFFSGEVLKVSDKSLLSRYVPCTIYDSENNVKWRFVIKINPQYYGLFSKREVPFVIEDWEKITFLNDNLIYKIDSDYWGQPTEPVILDRSVSHMISWQSVDYKIGNTIEYFQLPPKPELIKNENKDGSISFILDGDSSYNLSIIDDNTGLSPELYPEICLDILYGDSISGNMKIGIYSDSVYQGMEEVSYKIDKRPPSAPIITSSAKTFYSRETVNIDITGDENSQLYIAFSQPFIIENTKEVYKPESPCFKNIEMSDFQIYNDINYTKQLNPVEQKVVYYEVQAYCLKDNKKSTVAKYSVIVDQSSFYFNKNAKDSLGDGTLLNPFTTLEQCLNAIKNIRSVTLSLTGDLYIDKNFEVHSNFKIVNNREGRIIFSPTGSIEMAGSTLEIENCRIHKISSSSVSLIVPLFKLKRGSLMMKNCQITGDFAKNGTVIDSFGSTVTIEDTIASVSSDSYVSFISSIDSRVYMNKSSISGAGDTCVLLSVSKGNVNITNCNFKISGKIGRIAELFNTEATFENNEFKGELGNKGKSVIPVFADKKTKLIEKGNSKIGF